jgi:hypothetical protein
VGRLVIGRDASAIRNQDGLALLPCGLQAKVVIDAAIAEDRVSAVRRLLQVARGFGIKVVSGTSSCTGESTGGNAEDAPTAAASCTVGFLISPTR